MGASPSGLATGNCRSGQTLKTPKYLSACDRDEHGCEEGAGTEMILVVYYESNEVRFSIDFSFLFSFYFSENARVA